MDRRTFILASATFVASCSRQSGAERAASDGAAALGLQLYTVRDLMSDDLPATLRLVADIGYREVEFAGYFDTPPQEIRRILEDVGLRAPAAHIAYEVFAADIERVIEEAKAVGHGFVVVPAIPGDERASLDDYRRHAENFNRWAETCASSGLQFAYHNHEFEFAEIDGQVPYDVLLSATDPELVKMEIDLAWARHGNADALSYFENWPGRFPLCHIKDLDADGNEADIGEGDVAFEKIFAEAEQAGLQHGFVERDHPTDTRESIQRNFEAIGPLWSRYMG